MEKTISYTPKGVCARRIDIVIDGDIVKKVTFVGGCAGNTQGVSRLAEGRKVQDLIDILSDVKCGGSRSHDTSCPAQFALALKEALEQK